MKHFIFYWSGIVAIATGAILLCGWAMILQGQYGICQIRNRETAPGECCKWVDDCSPCQCVTIVAYWYPAKHTIHLLPYENGDDCWTTGDPWPMLNKDYPVGANKTCYSDDIDSANVKVSSPSTQQAERIVFILGLVFMGLGVTAIGLGILFNVLDCRREDREDRENLSQNMEYDVIN